MGCGSGSRAPRGVLIGPRPAIRRAGFRMSFIPGADEAKPRLRCSRRPSALPALCLRPFAPRLGTAAVSRRGSGTQRMKGLEMPPRRTSLCAWPVRGPPCLRLSLPLGLSGCLLACGTGTTPPQRLCAAPRVPPLSLGLWLGVQPPWGVGHGTWGFEHAASLHRTVAITVAGRRGTLSLPRRPCDDRSLLTLAPALWEHRRLVQR